MTRVLAFFSLLLQLFGGNAFSMMKSVPRIIEDEFQIPDQLIIERANFVILSGCSGSGKSTLLSELSSLGYQVVAEPGRQVVKEQNSIGGDGLPWTNPLKFMDLTLSKYIFSFNSIPERSKWVFFDRGIPDAVAHFHHVKEPVPNYLKNAVEKFRYSAVIFVTPPWPEIFRNDSERTHDLSSAISAYEASLTSFKGLGYTVLEVPRLHSSERAKFILEALRKE